jgi:hypothetical protein
MNEAQDAAVAAQAWLAHLQAPAAAMMSAPLTAAGTAAASLAALAAEALARERSLLVVTPDDEPLPDISNALDLNLRPLCLVLPAADYACRIALRATLSLLRSRLARAGDDAEGPAWARQRQRLGRQAKLWQACLDWSKRGLDQEPWPDALPELFPVRILPWALARNLAVVSEWVVVLGMAADACREAWPGAERTLFLDTAAAAGPGGALAAADETLRLRAELEVLTQELSDLELELATAQAEIADFTRRYHLLVGSRMATLDTLIAEIDARQVRARPDDADAIRHAEQSRARAERSRRESERFVSADQETRRPFAPTQDLKKLYRQLAQKIHPDRASDEADRDWRTQLMTEANRAYQAGDEGGLREIMTLWQEGGRRPRSGRTDAGLAAEVAGLKRRVAEIEAELNRLFGSRLYELFTAANIARRAGRDLLQEMADKLDADIAAARTRLGGLN